MKRIHTLYLAVLTLALVVGCSIDDNANQNASLQESLNDSQDGDDDSGDAMDDDNQDESSSAPENATYNVTFIGEWTAESHPTQFPDDDHFSKTVLFTHAAERTLFTVGDMASGGIEDMAENGNNDRLINEMQHIVDAGDAEMFILGPSSIRGNDTDELVVEATQDFSSLSYVAMVAPSPDWFTGVSGVQLFKDGAWIKTLEIDVVAYDAGTEDGNEFRYDNMASNPQQPISIITEAPLGNGTAVEPRLGRLVISLQQ